MVLEDITSLPNEAIFIKVWSYLEVVEVREHFRLKEDAWDFLNIVPIWPVYIGIEVYTNSPGYITSWDDNESYLSDAGYKIINIDFIYDDISPLEAVIKQIRKEIKENI